MITLAGYCNVYCSLFLFLRNGEQLFGSMSDGKNVNKPHSNEGWQHFIDYNYKQWKKVATVAGMAFTLLSAGFFVGKFYQSLQNKFDILELKTQHSDEIQKIRHEFTWEKIGDMRRNQSILDNITTSGKEGKNEK